MEAKNIKVSVVIPVYNVEKFLPKCLNSVMAQSYENLEILVVDDGSSDRSGVICDEYGEKDARITVFHKENGGLSDARNYALDYVSGAYVTFIDSDDYVDERFIETLLDNAISNNAEISICNYKTVEEDDEQNDFDKINKIRIFSEEESMQQILYGEYIMQFSVAWGKLYKSEIFSDLRYPKGRKFEDVAIAHLCYNQIRQSVYSDAQLYFYLHRKGSIKNSGRFKDADVIKSAFDRLIFFKEYNRGRYYTEAKKQYMTAQIGTYARFAETTNELKAARKNIYEGFKTFYKENKGDVFGLNSFSMRCLLFLVAPKLYSKLILTIKNG